MADTWEWAAVYEDGVRLTERAAGGFGAVNLERCVAVELRSRRLFAGKALRVEVDVQRGQRAVFFRRQQITVSLDGIRRGRGPTLTVAGFEGPAGSAYLLAEGDGTVRLTDRI